LWIGVLAGLAAWPQVVGAGAAPGGETAPTAEELPAGYEILSADAGWCGPRILYFFCRFYGSEPSLDEVVQTCRSDQGGMTSLVDLVRAAELLELEPVAMEASLDQVAGSGRPAILCLRNNAPLSPDGGSQAVGSTVHFVGLVGPEENGRFWFVDPSRRAVAFPAGLDSLRDRFTGQAILLKGSSSVLVYPGWVRAAGAGVLLAVALLGGILAARQWRKKRTVEA
jgi:hypothetical protein